MQVILIQNVENLGKVGEKKEVKPGYGRNFLLKKNLAVLPGDPRAKEIHLLNKKALQDKAVKNASIKEIAEKIEGQKYVFQMKADEKGKLYGSIGPEQIAKKLGIDEKLVTKHFKEIGEFDLEINFSPEVKSKVKIVVEKEK